MGDLLIMSKKELQRKTIFDLVKIGQITCLDASKRLDLSYRQTRRSYGRYITEGDEGLIHRNRGKPSHRAFSPTLKKSVIALFKEKYWDFGPTLAAEKLDEDDKIKVSVETLRTWLKSEGLWLPKRKRKAHRSRRARRSRFGELLQMDGSIHAWFTGIETKQCLMNFVDDATGKTLALLDTGETTDVAFRLLKWWIKLHGIPMAIYVDLKSLYISPKSLRHNDEDVLVEPEWLTHFSRACKSLGIEVIKAYSPQAKGRVERNHGVYQDRFVKELRLRGINTIEGANKLLQSRFIDSLNKKFIKTPASTEDAHIALMPEQNLDDIMCWEYTRTVHNDWVVRFENQLLQIQKTRLAHVRPKQKVTLKRHLNGKITIWCKGVKLSYSLIEHRVKEQKETKEYTHQARSKNSRENKSKSPWSQFNPGWLKQSKEHLEAIT